MMIKETGISNMDVLLFKSNQEAKIEKLLTEKIKMILSGHKTRINLLSFKDISL